MAPCCGAPRSRVMVHCGFVPRHAAAHNLCHDAPWTCTTAHHGSVPKGTIDSCRVDSCCGVPYTCAEVHCEPMSNCATDRCRRCWRTSAAVHRIAVLSCDACICLPQVPGAIFLHHASIYMGLFYVCATVHCIPCHYVFEPTAHHGLVPGCTVDLK